MGSFRTYTGLRVLEPRTEEFRNISGCGKESGPRSRGGGAPGGSPLGLGTEKDRAASQRGLRPDLLRLTSTRPKPPNSPEPKASHKPFAKAKPAGFTRTCNVGSQRRVHEALSTLHLHGASRAVSTPAWPFATQLQLASAPRTDMNRIRMPRDELKQSGAG